MVTIKVVDIARPWAMMSRHPLEFRRCCALVVDHGCLVAHEFAFDGLSPCLFLLTGNITENVVHCFQCPAPCFGYEIECPDKGQQAEDGEERISPLRDIFELVLRVQGQSWRLHP